MKIEGFSGKAHWYRGNLHSHTVVSDGKLQPKEAAELYRKGGYQFLCLSEHDIYTDFSAEFNREDFIILPGIEYSAILYDNQESAKRLKIHHLHGILGTQEMQKQAKSPLLTHMQHIPPLKFYGGWDGAAVAQEMADMLAGHGLVTTYNHPIWSRTEQDEFANTRGLHMLEIFNYDTVLESETGYDVTYWDHMLRAGYKVNAFASDDNHNDGLEDSCGGWVCVNADTLTQEDLVRELIAGNYYSSAGPEIYDWHIEDGVAHIRCSNVNRITFAAGNVINDGWTFHGTPLEDDLCEAAYPLKGHELYLRAECTDRYGRTAWTNPIYLG
ncbi:MAG: CehA/McbA family metallohydrolase [Oscillibacter sp.]